MASWSWSPPGPFKAARNARPTRGIRPCGRSLCPEVASAAQLKQSSAANPETRTKPPTNSASAGLHLHTQRLRGNSGLPDVLALRARHSHQITGIAATGTSIMKLRISEGRRYGLRLRSEQHRRNASCEHCHHHQHRQHHHYPIPTGASSS